MNSLFFALVLAVPVAVTTSCLKASPSHRSMSSQTFGAETAIAGPVSIVRAADGLSATISFTTNFHASCKLAWYQDVSPNPDPTTLTWTACTSPQPGKDFKETASDLKTEISYAFALKIWAQGQTEDKAIIKTIHENATTADPASRYTFRVDLPTSTAQIDGYTYATGLEGVQKDFLQTFACKPIESGRTFPGTRLASMPLNLVTASGFLPGVSTTNDDLAQGLTIVSTNQNYANTQWSLSVQSKSSSETVKLEIPPQLSSITATQDPSKSTLTSNIIVENTLEDVDLPAFMMGSTSPLNVTWTTNRSVDNSTALIIVTLTGPGHSGIMCGFDPKSGAGAIPGDMLVKFGTGRGFLTVRLETVQIPTKDRWFAQVIDWRTVQVLVQ